jgi:hypothetical protein
MKRLSIKPLEKNSDRTKPAEAFRNLAKKPQRAPRR